MLRHGAALREVGVHVGAVHFHRQREAAARARGADGRVRADDERPQVGQHQHVRADRDARSLLRKASAGTKIIHSWLRERGKGRLIKFAFYPTTQVPQSAHYAAKA